MFANQLRELRRASGLSPGDLAEKTFYARSTLSVAFSGDKLPTWDLVGKVLQACGANEGDQKLWRARWEAVDRGQWPDGIDVELAAAEQDPSSPHEPRVRRGSRGPRPPDLGRIWSMAELAQELDQFRKYRGLSWRRLAEMSEEDTYDSSPPPSNGIVAASTIHDAIIVRQAPSLALTLRIVQLCGGTTSQLVDWGSRWAKVAEEEASRNSNRRKQPHVPRESDVQVIAHTFMFLLDWTQGRPGRTAQVLALLLLPAAALAGAGYFLAMIYGGNSQTAFAILAALLGVATVPAVMRSARSVARGRSEVRGSRDTRLR